jgi:hypothetical protein
MVEETILDGQFEVNKWKYTEFIVIHGDRPASNRCQYAENLNIRKLKK